MVLQVRFGSAAKPPSTRGVRLEHPSYGLAGPLNSMLPDYSREALHQGNTEVIPELRPTRKSDLLGS